MQKTHILAYASLRMDQQKQFWPVNTSSTDKSKEEISTTPFFPSIMSPLNWKMEYNNKIIRHSVQIPIVWLYSYQWGFKNPACTMFDITIKWHTLSQHHHTSQLKTMKQFIMQSIYTLSFASLSISMSRKSRFGVSSISSYRKKECFNRLPNHIIAVFSIIFFLFETEWKHVSE